MTHLLTLTNAADEQALLVTGLPLARGRLMPSEPLLLLAGDRPCPAWFEVRTCWPDGSVRWLMGHALLPEGARDIQLATGQQVVPPSARPLYFDQANGCLSIWQNGLRILSIGSPMVNGHVDQTGGWDVSQVETSPVAPLFRLVHSPAGPLRTDIMLRADSSGQTLHLTCRYSVLGQDPLALGQLRQGFRVDLPGIRSSPAEDPDDLVLDLETGRVRLLRGKQRGPARLVPNESRTNSFDLVIGHADSPLFLNSGVSLRCMLRLGQDRPLAKIRLPDGYVAATQVFGHLPNLASETVRYVAPGLSDGLDRLLADGLRQTETVSQPGLLHDGDWQLAPGQYGAVGYRAFADNEYDVPYAYFLAYASGNNPGYLDLALRGSWHMADVDCKMTDGDMLYHGYNEEAEDHQLHRVSRGDLGHYWTDGLWAAFFWSGDLFAREAARRLTDRMIRHFSTVPPQEAFSVCERNIGWPLMVLVSALEAGEADLPLRSCCESLLAFLDAYFQNPDRFFLDPAGPTWWRTALQDGSKPFMLGVLGEAVARYGDLTADPRCSGILTRIANFVMTLYDPVRADFAYEYNAFGPNHRRIAAQQLIPLFARTLLDGLWRGVLTPICEQAVAALHASAWCLYGEQTGKDIALLVRGLLPALAMLLEIEQAQRQAAITAIKPSTGQPRSGLSFRTGPCGEPVIEHLEPGLYSDAGSIAIRYGPLEAPCDTLNLRALLHLCAEPPRQSALSVLVFYDRIQVRFYDADSRLIDSLDHFPGQVFFQPGSCHELSLSYRAPGPASLTVDGRMVDKTHLDRPLSLAFNSCQTGGKPGNWRALGTVAADADFGLPSDKENGG